jgi:hypothetical protein
MAPRAVARGRDYQEEAAVRADGRVKRLFFAHAITLAPTT